MQYGAATDYRVAYGYDGLLRLNSVTGSAAPAFTYTYTANANLVARVAQLSGYCRDTTYEPASNRVSDLNHTWGPAADLMVAASYQYNNAGLRSVEKTDGINLMALLQRSSGLYSDFTYTDRRELATAGQYDLTAAWAKGAAVAGTARDYDYDPIGNRTADQSGSYTPNALNQYSAAPGVATLTYDLAGNLTADGTRTYTYDAENRLASVTRAGTTTTFKYDYLGRRIAKKVGTAAEIRFVYDGWNLIAEIDSSTFAILRSYTWGLDASGGLQGAGGVGGLLCIASGSNRYYPIYDASYNIIGLYDGTGALAAAYRYDPFGNVLQSAGTAALVNPFGFSTKFTDRDSTTEGGLVYYGLRYYHPKLGRFINRDPVEEQGGLNLYAFCGNDGVNRWDYLGMDAASQSEYECLYRQQISSAVIHGAMTQNGGPNRPEAGEVVELDPFEVRATWAEAAAAAAEDERMKRSQAEAFSRFQMEEWQRNFNERLSTEKMIGSLGQWAVRPDIHDYRVDLGALAIESEYWGLATDLGVDLALLKGNFDLGTWKALRAFINCYGYAIRLTSPDQNMGARQTPGFRGGGPASRLASITVENIARAAISDGLFASEKEAGPGSMRIYVVTGGGRMQISPGVYKDIRDFHFYREEKALGLWSHKPGLRSFSFRDGSGKLIRNPSAADHNYKFNETGEYVNYSDNGMYLWVRN